MQIVEPNTFFGLEACRHVNEEDGTFVQHLRVLITGREAVGREAEAVEWCRCWRSWTTT